MRVQGGQTLLTRAPGTGAGASVSFPRGWAPLGGVVEEGSAPSSGRGGVACRTVSRGGVGLLAQVSFLEPLPEGAMAAEARSGSS